MKAKLKVGDEVLVQAGKDRGRKGIILDLDLQKSKVRVKDVGIQTHFDKKEGILKRERFIDYSNVKLVKKAEAKDYKSKKKAGIFAKKSK